MSDRTIDIIGQIFWFGILITPVFSFLIVRKSSSLSIGGKFIAGGLITILLAIVFFVIALVCLMNNFGFS